MADVQIQATINLPAFGLKWGETGTVDEQSPALAGALAAGHAIRLAPERKPRNTEPEQPQSDPTPEG